MTRQLIILTLIFLVTISLWAQKTSTSKLYDNKRRLLADTSLIITKKQLKKWTAIEDTLTKVILSRLVYPQMEFENGMSGKVIISFTLDTLGKFNDFRLEKHYSEWSQDSIKSDIKSFKRESIRSTTLFSGMFTENGFLSSKHLIERYYLPIEFIPNASSTTKQIKNGWLTFEKNYDRSKEVIQK